MARDLEESQARHTTALGARTRRASSGSGAVTGQPPELGTLLGVWAHPDDDTYLSAGLMAHAVGKGARVVCVTATRGEGGSWDEVRWPTSEMGKVREAELLSSLRLLGVEEHIWLDYYDGTCAEVDFQEGVGRVAALLNLVRPDSVLTFGPDGMTDHPDHKAVSAWTTEAFRRVGKPEARLYYATMTPAWAEEFVPLMNQFNVFGDGTPPITAPDQLAIDFVLPGDLLEVKLRAIEMHVSQIEGMLNAFGRDFFRRAHKAEFFRLATER